MSADTPFDIIIKGGMVYDGTGADGRIADVAIRGDRIAGVGDFDMPRLRARSTRAGSRLRPVSSTCSHGQPNRLFRTDAPKAKFARASPQKSWARATRWVR